MRLGFSNLIVNSISNLQFQELISLSDCIDWAPSIKNPKWDIISENGQPTVHTSVPVSAIQSLFFGVKGLHFMKSDAEFKVMFNHLQFLTNVADVYNAPFVLWGSPGTRNVESSQISHELINQRLDAIYKLFSKSNASFLIEAVSPNFGCKFINSSKQLVALTEKYSRNDIHLHLDTGQMLDEGLDVLDFIESNIANLRHIHLSEPNFYYTGKYNDLFSDVMALLNDQCFKGDVVIEVQNIDLSKVNEFTLFYSSLKS